MKHLYPMRLAPSLHETIWGGRRLEVEGWKQLPPGNILIGESWETELNATVRNGPYAGMTLSQIVHELGSLLIGDHAAAIAGGNFPLLAKFTDIRLPVSVHVHPNDRFAAQHENGKLGKFEAWYILAVDPNATIAHGFKRPTSPAEVEDATRNGSIEDLLHREAIHSGNVVLVPPRTVHAVSGGILLYEIQQYSDITYRLYDYGRLTKTGTPRPLHLDSSLRVLHYDKSPQIFAKPVSLKINSGYEDTCLVACKYFVMRKLLLKQQESTSSWSDTTKSSCILLTSLGTEVEIRYGPTLRNVESLSRGETMIIPAELGSYCIEGRGSLLYSYVPLPSDEAWRLWEESNG